MYLKIKSNNKFPEESESIVVIFYENREIAKRNYISLRVYLSSTTGKTNSMTTE